MSHSSWEHSPLRQGRHGSRQGKRGRKQRKLAGQAVPEKQEVKRKWVQVIKTQGWILVTHF